MKLLNVRGLGRDNHGMYDYRVEGLGQETRECIMQGLYWGLYSCLIFPTDHQKVTAVRSVGVAKRKAVPRIGTSE